MGKPAVMQQERFVPQDRIVPQARYVPQALPHRMLYEEQSQPQQAVPYRAPLTTSAEEEGSKTIKYTNFAVSTQMIDAADDSSRKSPSDSSRESGSEQQPAKRFKAGPLSSIGGSLRAAVSRATTAIATTLVNSDSQVMLYLDDTTDNRPAAALDLLAIVCKADNSSTPAFSAGSGSGHSTVLYDPSLLEKDHKSSAMAVPIFGTILVLPCVMFHTWCFQLDNFRDNSMLDYAPNNMLLSLCCLLGAFGCSYLPVWAKRLLRKLSLDTDDSDKTNEVRADWTVAYYCYVMPWFQAALAFQTYNESGSLYKATASHLVMPCVAVTLALMTHGQGISSCRRVLLFIGFPIFCILQQENASYEFWCVEIARWHLQGAVTNTSLIVPLQESLFILAAMFLVSPHRLINYIAIVVAGMIASSAKILWIRYHDPSFSESNVVPEPAHHYQTHIQPKA